MNPRGWSTVRVVLRRFRPSWRSVLALASGITSLVACLELKLGTGLAVVLAMFTAALVFSLVARRDIAPAPREPLRQPVQRRRVDVRAGHEVLAMRDIGGSAFGGDFIPAGTRGVVTGTSWGNVDVTFRVDGVFGGHVSRTRVPTDDVRRI